MWRENKLSKILKATILVSLIILGVFLAGCQGKEETPQELSGELKITSRAVLVPLIKEWAKVFMEKHPNVKINVSGNKCANVTKLVGEGKANLGFMGRELTSAEKEKYPDLKQVIVGKRNRSIVIIVHPNNPVNELSLEEIAKIFAGEITNWKEVGGPDKDIHVVVIEKGCKRAILNKLVMKPYKKNVTANALTKQSFEEIIDVVSEDENSIGYVYPKYINETVKDRVKVLKIDGVEPTNENIMSGRYPLTEYVYILIRKEPSELEKAFMHFVLSEEGQKIMEDMGYIRIKGVGKQLKP